MPNEDKDLKQELMEQAHNQVCDAIDKKIQAVDSLPPDAVPENRLQLMVQMAALGMGPNAIAKRLRMTKQKTSNLMQSTSFQEAVSTVQNEIRKDSTKIFKTLVLDSIQTGYKVMTDPKEKGSVRAEVAFKFMDRALGKPTQEIKHEGGMLRELIQMMDSAQKEQPVVQEGEWWDIKRKGDSSG